MFQRPPESLVPSVPMAVHDLAPVVAALARDALNARPPFVRPPEALAATVAPAVRDDAPVVIAAVKAPPAADAPDTVASCRANPNVFQPRSTQRGLVSGAPLAPDAALLADPARFGLALSAAAKAQTSDLVIYNAQYMTIAYQRGDVPALFGVCTDVVIRAYRSLDIDLQELVHESRPGGSDKNIDHRRTELLRKFFATYGEQLAATPYIEDYHPGDIVTYYRPQNKSSTAHIAVVTDVVAPSGRPMIAHNRGWGVQLEDALFVDQMTGHYRFRGTIGGTAVARGPKAPLTRMAASVTAAALPQSTRQPVKAGVGVPRDLVMMQPPMGLGLAPR